MNFLSSGLNHNHKRIKFSQRTKGGLSSLTTQGGVYLTQLTDALQHTVTLPAFTRSTQIRQRKATFHVGFAPICNTLRDGKKQHFSPSYFTGMTYNEEKVKEFTTVNSISTTQRDTEVIKKTFCRMFPIDFILKRSRFFMFPSHVLLYFSCLENSFFHKSISTFLNSDLAF